MATRKQYELITSEIITALEGGTVPWQRPWTKPAAINADHNGFTGRGYSGINPIILWAVASRRGYTSNVWLTYNQLTKLGGTLIPSDGQRRKAYVYFWQFEKRDSTDPDADKTEKYTYPVMRIYGVFNLEETVNVKLPKRETVEPEELIEWNPITDAQAIVDTYIDRESNLRLLHRIGNHAAYNIEKDIITMPMQNQFPDQGEYYSTIYHEMAHSTGNKSRLARFEDREIALAPFGTEDYSKEELIAEFTSAFLCHHVGISSTRANSVAYIKNWLAVLKDEPKMAVNAAGKAQLATNYILMAKSSASLE